MFFTADDVVADRLVDSSGWLKGAYILSLSKEAPIRHSMLDIRGDSPNISSGVLNVFVK